MSLKPKAKTEVEEAMIDGIWSDDPSRQLESIIKFRKILSQAQNAEFDIKGKVIWAISNATSGGSHDQIKYLVKQGCIKLLCDLLVCPYPRAILKCLYGLENIFRAGEAEKNIGEVNCYSQLIEDAEGVEKIENLQRHENNVIYEKALKILETYWVA